MAVMDEKMMLMDVEYPTDWEMEQEIHAIVEQAIPEKRSMIERIRQIYWGPGLRVIFYNSGMLWLLTVMSYFVICFLGLQISGVEDVRKYIVVFLGIPVCVLIFGFLSCYFDESDSVMELKQTLHYSMSYMIGLRMFYFSIFMIIVNSCLIGIFCSVGGTIILSLGAFGITSTLFFAVATIYLYHKYSKSFLFGILGGLWMIMAMGIRQLPIAYFEFVFEYIPIGVHLTVSLGCFVWFVVLIKRLEEKDAYSFAC